ncbi:hypothetical protein [Desulfoplanes formicivorans]|uniref:Uncharacterized protein n=1 Tax=Desulfoplanes formicivorans TaxID=1592317 RepID=A0A194AE18_9BACT|nr:hypothetical protein [Desulfoplanes formicivorans]GAU07578.1 hypothetical protein DPF_0268 [Desulfoplanes formicivorans]
MLRNLLKKWAHLTANRSKHEEIAPESFASLTSEILELARLVGTIRPEDHQLSHRLTKLEREIRQLQSLLNTREFKRLSLEKRKQLKKNLVFSRQQLLEAMGAAIPPTDRIQ